MAELKVDPGKEVRCYYIRFSCEDCDNEFSIPVPERVKMNIVGAWQFECLDCGTVTGWIPGFIMGIEGAVVEESNV